MDTQVKASISLTVSLTLNEKEARALSAMVGYSPEAFIRGFYKQLGSHYLGPHETALPGLFESIRGQLDPALNRVDRARKEFLLYK